MSMVVANEELVAAIVRGDVRAVDQALQSGVSPDSEVVEEAEDGHSWRRHMSLLFLAAKCDQRGVAELLVNRGADVDKGCGNYGETPLFVASKEGHKQTAMMLLDHGALVNKAIIGGWTPLFVAAQRGHTDVVTLLIDRGARVDKADNEGKTPLHLSAMCGHKDVAALLIDRGAVVEPASSGLRERRLAGVFQQRIKYQYRIDKMGYVWVTAARALVGPRPTHCRRGTCHALVWPAVRKGGSSAFLPDSPKPNGVVERRKEKHTCQRLAR